MRILKRIDNLIDKIIDKYMSGHINIGNKSTIYGRNAMQWAMNIYTKKYGYICFRLPLTVCNKWKPLYFYISPNGTPWASTFYLGKDNNEKKLSKLRRQYFGHNFSVDTWREQLWYLRDHGKISDQLLREDKLKSLLNE